MRSTDPPTKDRLGRELKSGDYVLCAATFGSTPTLVFARVLEVRQPLVLDQHHPKYQLFIWAAIEDLREGRRVYTRYQRPGLYERPDRMIRVELRDVPEEVEEALGRSPVTDLLPTYQVTDPCPDCGGRLRIVHHLDDEGKHWCPTHFLECVDCREWHPEGEPHGCNVWGEHESRAPTSPAPGPDEGTTATE